MPKFHLYVIHTASLVHRQARLHGTIQAIREIASRCGYDFRSIIVLPPDIGVLQARVAELSDRVKYDDTGFQDLDKMRSVLNLEQISNYEKHREAWQRIMKEVESEEDVCMVLEDDAVMIPEFQNHFQQFVQTQLKQAWDFYALSVSVPYNGDTILQRISENMRVLPSKCAYAIKPSKEVLEALLKESETIRFGMRLHLSYMFLKLPNINAVVSNKQCIMEGSKVGLYPSSTHASNVLMFNQEYMELYNMLHAPDLSEQKATQIFDRVKHIPNPDLIHIYGVILYKCGKVKEASQLLTMAIELMKKQHGMLNSQSDLLNNCINMYENMQWDLPEYLSTPSKFDSILEQAHQQATAQ